MNVEAFRTLYDYHISENRKIWQRHLAELPEEIWTQPLDYSMGSLRTQIAHLIRVDHIWFLDLGAPMPAEEIDEQNPGKDRAALRAYWDQVEDAMRTYINSLTEETLASKPLQGEDAELAVWQVLLHVANHGTDHRAQILRALHDAGQKTGPQDLVFYLYDQQQKPG
ncbi:MAG: DinB family protein [Anaerolineales bacterium]|nr:DinB family protein [Anaerolineales bacterium]